MKYKYKLIEGIPYVVQMPTWDEPQLAFFHTVADYEDYYVEYNKHLADIPKYQLNKEMLEWEGREDLIEGKDFDLEFQVPYNGTNDFYFAEPLPTQQEAIPTEQPKSARDWYEKKYTKVNISHPCGLDFEDIFGLMEEYAQFKQGNDDKISKAIECVPYSSYERLWENHQEALQEIIKLSDKLNSK